MYICYGGAWLFNKGGVRMADNELLGKGEETKVEESPIDNAEIEEALESVPPEHRKVIERMIISSSVQMRSIVSPETAVMKKITTEHISQYLNGAEQEMKNSYAEKFHKKVFTFLSMIVAMIFFVIIIILLKEIPDVMEKVIYAVGGVIAGAFGGYGLGKNQRDD